MTLVVARISNGVVAIAADTLLTEHGMALPISQGTIKICFLPGKICVGFANSPELAERDIQNFINKFPFGTDLETSILYFELSSKNTGNDYIIASCDGPKIVKIANGRRAQTVSQTVWIGDREAYNRFVEIDRKYRRSLDTGRAVSISIFADEMDGSPASSLYYAMKNTVADKSIASVGGLVAVASSRIDGFRFSSFCDLLYDWPKQKDDKYVVSLDEPITYSSSEENFRYSLSHIPSGFLNANFLAFHFLKGNLLYVFYGDYNGLARRCYFKTDVAPEDIYNTIGGHFGFDLNWLVWVFSGLPADLSAVELDVAGAMGVRTGFICHANTHTNDRKQAIIHAYAPPYRDE